MTVNINNSNATMHSGQPQGTYMPGTLLTIGNHRVVVGRFLAEGGFAHVYLVQLGGNPENVLREQTGPLFEMGPDFVVMKRLACADQESLLPFQNEIRFMKVLSGHRNVVRFIDSSVGPLHNGGFEVLILMEYCRGGHLVDFLNSRLSNRPKEEEVLRIFDHVTSAVAHMHLSSPSGPIIHRDIKIENVLIDEVSPDGSANNVTFKLCDFGSATDRQELPGTTRTVRDMQRMEEEVNRVTTFQYRAPEMLDLFSRKGMTEKVDIWALGVFLYKLCYYTTPFEDSGRLAILSGRYNIPDHPPYSVNVKQLICT
ncbi:serine/threonine-protein kinase ppk30 [Cladochytrium replicatum]|nr:serine/threonine-protein kinase ppk30 [Cladochytrium replicatum]